jgi:DNA-binding transcriptional MerR regulator
MAHDKEHRLQIGDVAARTGLSLKTIRYYEDVGLLPESERTPGGFRLYTEHAVERLLLIMHMKPLDFSLAEMKELLDAVDALPAARARGAEAARGELVPVIERFREEIEARTMKLRKRLGDAQGFHALLGRHLDDLT